MKALITSFLLLTSLVGFSQNDTLSSSLEKVKAKLNTATDSSGSYSDDDEPWTGPVTTEVSFKGEGGLPNFINRNLDNDFISYIHQNKIRGRLFVIIVVGKNGSVISSKIQRGLDPVVDDKIISIVNKST